MIVKCPECKGSIICPECWKGHAPSHQRCSEECVADLLVVNRIVFCNVCNKNVHEKCKKKLMCVACMSEKKIIQCAHVDSSNNRCSVREQFRGSHLINRNDFLGDYKERALEICRCSDDCEKSVCSLHGSECVHCKDIIAVACMGSHLNCDLCKVFKSCCNVIKPKRDRFYHFGEPLCKCGSKLERRILYMFTKYRCASIGSGYCCKCIVNLTKNNIAFFPLMSHREHPICLCGEKYCPEYLSDCGCCGKQNVHDRMNRMLPRACIDCGPMLFKSWVCCECTLYRTKIKKVLVEHMTIPIVLIDIISAFFEPAITYEHYKCPISNNLVCVNHVRKCFECQLPTSEKNLDPCKNCGKRFCFRCLKTHVLVSQCGCTVYKCNRKYAQCAFCPGLKNIFHIKSVYIKDPSKSKPLLTKICCKCIQTQNIEIQTL